jgi:ankyrin repeat protein
MQVILSLSQSMQDNLILNVPNSHAIPYYDGLPSEDATLQYLTEEEFYKKFGCPYKEGLWTQVSLKQFKWNNITLNQDGVISGITHQALEKGIREVIEGKTSDFLAITRMDNKVGYGVFTTQKIPKHTVICIYSGEMLLGINATSQDTNDYSFYTGNFHVESYKKRGKASFMQHLPGNSEAFSENKNNFATTNVMLEFVIIDNVPVIPIVTLRDIEAGEQIGFSYGEAYWKTRGTPEVFYHSGKLAPRDKYSLRQLALSYEYKASSNISTHNNLPQTKSSTEKTGIFFGRFKTDDPNKALRRAAAMTNDKNDLAILLKEKNTDIDSQDEVANKGYTALHLAIIHGKTENALFLLKNNAKYIIIDRQNKTVLDYIIELNREEPLNFIKDHICRHYGSSDLPFLLRSAADKGDKETLQVMIASKIDVNQPGKTSGQTALHRAVQHGHLKCIELLMQSNADPKLQDVHGKSAYDYVKTDKIRELLKSPTNVNSLKST